MALVFSFATPAFAQAKLNYTWNTDQGDTVRITSHFRGGTYTGVVDLGAAGFSCAVSGKIATADHEVRALTSNNINADRTVMDGASVIDNGGITPAAFTADRYVSFRWVDGAQGDFITLSCTAGAATVAYSGGTTVAAELDSLNALKADAADQTEILLQGENGVADVSDPNDSAASPDVECGSAIPGKCMFISDKGLEFVNTSTTQWRASAAMHYNYIYEPYTSQSIGASLSADKCLPNPWSNSGDRVAVCSGHKTEYRAHTDITLDKMTLFVTHASGSALVDRGCAICVSLDGGSTCVADTDISLPAADGTTFAVGLVNSKALNIQVNEGDFFQLYAVRGEFSGATGEGVCSGLGNQHLGLSLEIYER